MVSLREKEVRFYRKGKIPVGKANVY